MLELGAQPGSSSQLPPSTIEQLRDARDHKPTMCNFIKFAYSTLFVFFCIGVIVNLILGRETKVSHDVSPALAMVVIVVAMFWLFMVEGGQASLVGLPPVERALYKDTHPITHSICSLACANFPFRTLTQSPPRSL